MKRLLIAAVAAAALWLAACSGGGGNTVLPPPAGNFSNTSLNGTYAFVTSGEVFTPGSLSAVPLSRVGSFVADGMGGITSGIEDVNSAGQANLATPLTGSYMIGADGRGTLTLNATPPGGTTTTLSFGIVLTSGSNGTSPANDGLMIDETFSTQASTGSGNFVRQDPTTFTATVPSSAGTFVFDFSGLDSAQAPDSIVGEFTVNSGVVSNGEEDENDNGNIQPTPTPVSFSGTMAFDSTNPSTLNAFGRGIAALKGIQYVFYIVDGTRIRFLSSTGGMLSGDAVLQPAAPATPSGDFVFIVAGATGGGGVTRVGRFTISGSSVTNALVDTNDADKFTQTNSVINTSVTMDPAIPGRGVVVFQDKNLSVPFTFVIYLSSTTSGVIQEQSQSAANGPIDVADGSISAQMGGPFTSSNISGTYGINWSGLSIQNGGQFAVQDEEDFVAQAKVSSLSLTGAGDIFQFENRNGPQPDNLVGGSIIINGKGTGSDGQRNTMVVKLTKNGTTVNVNFVVYFASPQLAFFTNTSTSSNRIVAGILKAQQ
jgi:hypothetical protein